MIRFEGQAAEDQAIPPCVIEMRLDHPNNRPARNPHPPGAKNDSYVYSDPSIRFRNAGDGDMYVICPGNGTDCPGFRVRVDRHDTLLDKMPATTVALGALCTSHQMYYADGSLLRGFCIET